MTCAPGMPAATGGSLVQEPGCKINLYLRILARRDDGMHELETLFLHLPRPSDRLEVQALPEAGPAGLRFTCSAADLAGEDNLVVRAYEAFCRASGLRPPVAAHLEKRVPSGAGTGGGSADAAAMLQLMNELAHRQDKGLAPQHLASVAAGLGADVPFFLHRGAAWATGIGENLQPAPDVAAYVSDMQVLLCLPDFPVSTSWAYKAWDECFAGNSSLTASSDEGIRTFCPEALALYNSFEAVVMAAHPALGWLKDDLLRLGAQGALLSGSGSCVFGLFRNAQDAAHARQALVASHRALTCIQTSSGAHTGVSPSW